MHQGACPFKGLLYFALHGRTTRKYNKQLLADAKHDIKNYLHQGQSNYKIHKLKLVGKTKIHNIQRKTI